ncbi:MAG: hypothetical protein QM775_23225 [Pirellulales bacterium]
MTAAGFDVRVEKSGTKESEFDSANHGWFARKKVLILSYGAKSSLEHPMRNIINVSNTIDTVAGIGRDIVAVVTRNVGMWQDSMRHLHLALRRAPSALAGSFEGLKPQGFKKPKLQPAYAAAYAGTSLRATAGSVRCERRVVRSSSHPSVRIG